MLEGSDTEDEDAATPGDGIVGAKVVNAVVEAVHEELEEQQAATNDPDIARFVKRKLKDDDRARKINAR